MVLDNIEVLFIIIFLFVGYTIGYLHGHKETNHTFGYKKNKSNNQIYENIEKVTIDDKKFVVDIDTSKMQKKFTNLGEVKHSEENISQSIQKLKNMKG